MEEKKYRYYIKVILNNGTLYNDVQECNAFKVEGGMVIFYHVDKDRKFIVAAMYPSANIIIDSIREIKD